VLVVPGIGAHAEGPQIARLAARGKGGAKRRTKMRQSHLMMRAPIEGGLLNANQSRFETAAEGALESRKIVV
jgi:hypothetical protein